MSQENVEVIKLALDAFNRDPESALQLMDLEVEWDSRALDMPGLSGVYRGLAEVRRFWEPWFEAFENYRVELIELIDAGEAVVAVTEARGRGRESGIEIDRQWFTVYWVRGGKVAAVRNCTDRADALGAAGLSE